MSAADVCDANDIGELMASWIVSKIGVRETARNSGPEIDEWLRLVRQQPGAPWCAATVYAAADSAARSLGVVNPCPRTSGALKLWTLSDPVTHVVTPRRGDILVLDHGHGRGHAGIVEFVTANGVLTWVSGNTNEAGSREGNAVVRKSGDPGDVHHAELVGFVRLSLAPTRAALVG